MIKPIPKPGPKPKRPRKPLGRGAPIARTGKPKRNTWPNPVNPERERERHVECFSGGIGHDHYVRAAGCVVSMKLGIKPDTPPQAAHVVSRARGGKWFDTVGLSDKHHREQERWGNQWILETYGVDLEAEARRLTREHLKEIKAI